MLGGPQPSASTCLADCPVPLLQCPTSDAWSVNATAFCSGRGACLSGTGACSCWTGYAGEACEQCAYGWLRVGLRCVRLPGVAIKALPAPPAGVLSVQSADGTRISALVANYDDVMARTHFGSPGTLRRRALLASDAEPTSQHAYATVAELPPGAASAVVRAHGLESLVHVPAWLVGGTLVVAVFSMSTAAAVLLLLSGTRGKRAYLPL